MSSIALFFNDIAPVYTWKYFLLLSKKSTIYCTIIGTYTEVTEFSYDRFFEEMKLKFTVNIIFGKNFLNDYHRQNELSNDSKGHRFLTRDQACAGQWLLTEDEMFYVRCKMITFPYLLHLNENS